MLGIFNLLLILFIRTLIRTLHVVIIYYLPFYSHTENKVIDMNIHAISGQVKNEQLTNSQLTKNCNHARDEMFNRRLNSTEVVKSEGMAEEYRISFKQQYTNNVAPHVVSPSSSAGGHHHGHDIMSDEDEMENGTGQDGRTFSHKKFLDRKRADANKKSMSIHSIQQEIKSTRKQVKTAEEETANLVQDVATRQLDKVKIDGERQVESKKRSLEAEVQRNRSVKDSVQVARANSGTYAQQIAEKVSFNRWRDWDVESWGVASSFFGSLLLTNFIPPLHIKLLGEGTNGRTC